MFSPIMRSETVNMSKPCKVCAKPGNGNHYGAWTCESCKGFFRKYGRIGSESLICYGDSDCDLSSRKTGIICKLCRLKKCVKVGMKNAKLHGQVQRAVTTNDTHFQSPSPSSSSQKLEFMNSESSTVLTGTVNLSIPCEVCAKPAYGSNYGAWTCDSCKWFFRKYGSMETKSLICYGNSDCDLTSRKFGIICKLCRMKKCVKLGMKNAKSHRQVQREVTPNDMSSQSPSPSSSLFSLTAPFDLSTLRTLQEINDIVDSYEEGCCLTADKVRNLELKEFKMVNSQNVVLARAKTWLDYSKEYENDIKSLLPFIDELQDSFNSHDKAILLKRSAFQLYLLRKVHALNNNGLILSDGRVIKMINLQFLYGTPLAQEMLQFVNRLLELGCTDEDIAMFAAIVYYKPGNLEDLAHLNLQNPENLLPTQQKFENLFVKHAESRCVDQKVFQELIKLLPELERLKILHQQALEFLKPYRWMFPEGSLFVEVYDLDSKIDTVQNEFNLPSSSSVSNGSH